MATQTEIDKRASSSKSTAIKPNKPMVNANSNTSKINVSYTLYTGIGSINYTMK